MLHLEIFIVSTRPGRMGGMVANWFTEQARRHAKFEIEVVDLAEVNLPMMDEPRHPRLRQYEHDHTKAWSARVEKADAFIFVSPEYNFSTPPSLSNALNYLFQEWAYKPVGLVSYGGVSGGTRAAQMTKQIVTSLKMMPMVEAVTIPFFNQYIDNEARTFAPPAVQEQAAIIMLDELLKWGEALKSMRT